MASSLAPSGPTCDIWKGTNGAPASLSLYIHICVIIISTSLKLTKNKLALASRYSAIFIHTFGLGLWLVFFFFVSKYLNSVSYIFQLRFKLSLNRGLPEPAVMSLGHKEEAMIHFLCRFLHRDDSGEVPWNTANDHQMAEANELGFVFMSPSWSSNIIPRVNEPPPEQTAESQLLLFALGKSQLLGLGCSVGFCQDYLWHMSCIWQMLGQCQDYHHH